MGSVIMFNKFKNNVVDTHIKQTHFVEQIDTLITRLEWLKSSIEVNDRSMMKSRASRLINMLEETSVTCNIIKYFCS